MIPLPAQSGGMALSSSSEAFSRVRIDRALTDSGWDLLDSRQVALELHGNSGRVDYLLKDRNGRALCVLEAKREELDPYDAKEQARGYAENVHAPFILLSNGREHWFWNYARADEQDAYRIERLPSQADLERLLLKNLQPPRPLLTEVLGPDYLRACKPDVTLRRYQIKATDEIARRFDRERRRKFLLEMATGTGKTLLCAALIRRFLITRNAERVLFIVDRIELAKQTKEEFERHPARIQSRHFQDRPPPARRPARLLRRHRHHSIADDRSPLSHRIHALLL